MKKTLLLTTLLAAFALAAGSTAMADLKVGIVDMNKVIGGYYKTDEAKKRIAEAQTLAEKELQDMVDLYKKNAESINKLNEELNKPELSKEAKEKKSEDRDKKFDEYKRQEKEIVDFRNRHLKELSETANRMRAGIVEEITKLVNEKVKSEQFDMVLDKTGLSNNGVPIVLYSKDAADFSDDLIKTLNANKPKSADVKPSPAPSAAPKKAN